MQMKFILKRIVSFTLMLFVVVLSLCGCTNSVKDFSKTKIVVTSFAAYDWLVEILGNRAENFNICYLLDSGADMHSYQPSVDDMADIKDCDFLILVGGESEEWIIDSIENSENHNIILNFSELLCDNMKFEEHIEGMQDHEEEESEYDEHVWLSLKNAKRICEAICQFICEIDGENSGYYELNLSNYVDSLESLDMKYRDAISSSQIDTLIFADRFPFRYLTEDYGLKYYAAFAGCSAESEASFDTLIFLCDKADEVGAGAVIELEKSNDRIARTIAGNIKNEVEIVTMDSMQSVSCSDIKNGAKYINIMKENLNAVITALN